MDPAPSLGCSLKDVKWSSVAVPLDLLVSTYRLPQIARLDSGESRRGHGADPRGPQSRRGCARVCRGGWDRVGRGLPAPQALELARAAAAALARCSRLPPATARDVKIRAPAVYLKIRTPKKKKNQHWGNLCR